MKKIITFLFVCLLISITSKAQVWEPVGNSAGISSGAVGRLTLVDDSQDNLVVGYYDGSAGKGSVQRFDGTAWSYLGGGPGMTTSYATYNSLCVDDNGVVYFTNQASWPASGLKVRKFATDVWEDLPDATSNNVQVQSSAISADGTLFTVTGDDGGTVRKYVNGAWQQVGNTGFMGSYANYIDMSIANNGLIYVSWNNSGYVHVYANIVSASTSDLWKAVGNEPNIAPATSTENYNSCLAVDNNNNLFLAYVSSESSGRKLNVKKYDGSAWSQVGPENFTEYRVQHISIAVGANNIVYVAASNWEDENMLRNYVMAYEDENTGWYQAGTGYASEGQATYNSLAVDSQGNLFLAFMDSNLGKLSVRQLNLGVVSPESVEISAEGGAAPEITVDNGTLQLEATVLPESAPQDVVWSMESGENFATVDQNGLVTAITSNAVVTVKATALNTTIYGTIDVVITNQNSNIPPEEVMISTEDGIYPDIFEIGGSLQLLSEVLPREADQYVTWSIEEGSDVVSIDQDGMVTSLAEGYAVIRVTDDENTSLYDEIRVNVFENGCTQGRESGYYGLGFPISNSYTADDFLVEEEGRFALHTIRMNIICEETEITSVDLHFYKNDVDRPGSEITSVNNIVPTYQTFIPVSGVSLNYYEIELDLSEPVVFDQGTYWLSPHVTSSTGTTVYWEALSSGVNEFGLYSDDNDGHGWKSDGDTDAKVELTGNCSLMPLVVSTMYEEDTDIFVGESLELKATVNEQGLSQSVTWSVESGSEFATVNTSGLVTGTGVGKATIKATSVDDATVFSTLEVTVHDPNECFQQVFPNNMEYGYNFIGDLHQHLAVDIDVEEGQNFTISSVDVNTANYATQFSFTFYNDDNGLPGDEIIAETNGTIVHNRVIGFSIYQLYFQEYKVELETPVTLPAGAYWMEIESNAVAWESTSADVLGHLLAFKSDGTGGEWQYSNMGMELVYKLNGVCVPIIEEPWTFTVTGQAHTITVPTSANPNIFGEPLVPGDWVGVFFVDEYGNEVCGGATEILVFGQTVVTAYGDDPTTPEKDGFAAGETFRWRMFDDSEQMEYPGVATYDASMPNQGEFADLGLSKLTSLDVMYCQDYSFNQGWNSISSYIIPQDADVETLFDTMGDDLTIVRNLTSVYWPGENINTMVDFDNTSGYALRVNADVDFEICGSGFASNELTLSQGWQYMPVLNQCGVNTMDLLGDHLDDIVIVQDLIGTGVFWPAMNVYSLETLEPGKAYKMKTTAEFSVNFPECNYKSASVSTSGRVNSLTTHWGEFNMTPVTQVTAIETDAMKQLHKGDVIGAFTQNGNLCGYLTINSVNQQAITLFGSDGTNDDQNGFFEGEMISFKLYRTTTGEEFDLEVEYDNAIENTTGDFQSGSLAAISNLKMSSTGIGTPVSASLSIYPNPANDQLFIELDNGTNPVSITMMDATGQIITERTFAEKTGLDVSNVPAGVYFLKINSGSFSEVRKIMIK